MDKAHHELDGRMIPDADYLGQLLNNPKTRKLAYRLFSVIEDAHVDCQQADGSPVDLTFQLTFASEVISHMMMSVVVGMMLEGGYTEKEAIVRAIGMSTLAEDVALEEYTPDMMRRIRNAVEGMNVNGPEEEA